MSKILVTGATGFVGSHIVRKLLKLGHEVRVLRRQTSKTRMLDGLKIETAIGDVTDRDAVFASVNGCEAVFHVAGHVSFWKGNNELQKRINVDGTRYVVEACLAHQVKKLVHTSSIAGVGFSPGGKVGDETLEYNWWPYHINYCDTKHLGEQEVYKGVTKGLDAVVLNPAIIFGAGDLNLNGGAMVFQIARRKLAFYPPGGGCVCDVEDVADAHIQAWLKGRKGERYILGGDNYTWKELFSAIATELGVPAPRYPIPAPIYQVIGWSSDILSRYTHQEPPITSESVKISMVPCYYSSAKAIRDLGYKVTPFRETIRSTYQWYRETGYLKG